MFETKRYEIPWDQEERIQNARAIELRRNHQGRRTLKVGRKHKPACPESPLHPRARCSPRLQRVSSS